MTVNGVDLDAITAVTQAISPILDDAPELSGSFLLEVSSPGVERVLRTPAHYKGAIGDHRFHQGPHSTTRVACKARSSTRMPSTARSRSTVKREQLAYADITQARTVFEWGPQPRPGQRKAAHGKKAKSGAAASKGVTA